MNKLFIFIGIILFAVGTYLAAQPLEIYSDFAVSPTSATITYGQTQTFTATFRFQNPGQFVTWYVDGQYKTTTSGSSTQYVTSPLLSVGTHIVIAEGFDSSIEELFHVEATLTVSSTPVPTPTPTPPPSPPPPVPGKINVVVSSTDGGVTDPAVGAYEYTIGSAISFRAIADSGCTFLKWQFSNGATSTANPFSTTASESFAIQAVFQLPSPTPIPTPTPAPTPVPTPAPTPAPNPDPSEVNVQILSSNGGTTNPQPGLYEYEKGSQVVITQNPLEGWVFDYWLTSDGVKHYDSSFTATANNGFSVLPVFKQSGQNSDENEGSFLAASLQIGGIACGLTGVFYPRKKKET